MATDKYSQRYPSRFAMDRRNCLGMRGAKCQMPTRLRFSHDPEMFKLKEIGEFLLFRW